MHKIFYFTDIHGAWKLYDAIIKYCKQQEPECTIVYGGDACDRGLDGYKIMHDLLNDPQIIYLKGNHEDMFCRAAREIIEKFDFQNTSREKIEKVLNSTIYFDSRYENTCQSILNDGLSTLTDWIIDNKPMDFINSLEHLPLTFSYENYDFCHSGGIYKTFKAVADKEYNHKIVEARLEEAILWDRYAWDMGWQTNRICIHGHTPTIHLPARIYGKNKSFQDIHPCAWIGNFYIDNPEYQGYRVDMDTAAAISGRAYVLDVLTQKITGFFDPQAVELNGEIQIIEQYKLKLE